MPRITEELLRKRAEHNEGMLTNLEEVALHQFEIEKIENLDKLCRHLKILLLQNNIIEKIENVSKLKELQYLNLALNNVSLIENLEGCESLKKLDLTANFIDLEDYELSMYNLKKVEAIRELYLTGNPITDWKHHREYAIAIVDQLEMFDGKEVTPSERIIAKQNLENLTIDLYTKIEMKRIEKEQKNLENEEKKKYLAKIEEKLDEKYDKNEVEEYTKESRKKMYLNMAAEKEEEDRRKNPHKYEKKPESIMFKQDGEIRQCNEGKYEYLLKEWDDPDYTFFEMKVPKYLDTSMLDVNLNPHWVSVKIKGKLTQMKLMDEILVEQTVIQRAQITGNLLIKMKKLNPNFLLKRTIEKEEKTKELEKKKFEQSLKKQKIEILEKNENLDKQLIKTHDETTFDDVPDLE